MPIRLLFLLGCFSFLGVPSSFAQVDFPHEDLLINGKRAECEIELEKQLAQNPTDDNARFALGIVQFFGSIEAQAQAMHRYGFRNEFPVPIFRIPIPLNRDGQPVSYQDVKNSLRAMRDNLAKADKTLAAIQSDDVKIRSKVFLYSLDLNGNGKSDTGETVNAIATTVALGRTGIVERRKVVIHFDKADVHWLRGYCNLLMAFSEFLLSYDQQEMWEVVARHFFADPKMKNKFLEDEGNFGQWDGRRLIDYVAAIHQSRFKLVDPDGMKRVREHLLVTIEQSRIMWECIESESDDDLEWIPSPSQKSAVTNIRFSDEMVAAWREFLKEAEAILNGEMLIIFWRGKDETVGVDFKQFFVEPRDFDVILWIQGTGAVPYLKKGNVSKPETWARFNQIFRGNFIGFATWIN